ncbi:MAG: right-handed parallel beta-helix repeat-containing protein [Gemmatimonadota bacterium]
MVERALTREEAGSARLIQEALDALAPTGGRLVLPAMDLTLDRGLALRSGVELVGQGEATILRKGPGRVYPLSGYHNYGMCDVPLASAAGLEVGMTVSVHDNRTHGGFYETFATITWIDGDWVGLDHGIEADYRADEAPCLTTVYPLVFAHGVAGAAVRDLHLEGSRAGDDKAMGGCRGGALYFYQSRDLEVSGVSERDYRGEGLSFQMCRNVRILDSSFDGNTGNGLHPGAGSTEALFQGCRGAGNERSGFFFCVRANHLTVRECTFEANGLGISIGTRDCYNLIDGCTVTDNAGAGILARPSPRPTEVHSCQVRRCRIGGNCRREGRGQVELLSDAHDLIVVGNQIRGSTDRPAAGLFAEPTTRNLYALDNDIEGCARAMEVAAASLVSRPPSFDSGYGAAPLAGFRHLPGG